MSFTKFKKIMKKFNLLLLTLTFITFPFFTISGTNSDDKSGASTKKELSQILVNDNIINFIAGDLDLYVGNKPNGVSYPVLKMTFFKDNDQIYIDILAIDNTWHKLFSDDEKILGYFINDNGRLFLVSSRGDNIDINPYFIGTDIKRMFSGADSSVSPSLRKNPYWRYQYKGNETAIIDSANQESLTVATTKPKVSQKRRTRK